MADCVLKDLYAVIESRAGGDPAESYVASLFAKGTGKVAQKVGEEAVEVVIEAMRGDAKALCAESADLIFHLLVLLADQGVSIDDVLAELQRRVGTSGHDEKASRNQE